MRQTKIIATAGPSTETVKKLIALIKAGADVFRLNFSHSSHDWHRNMIDKIRRAATRAEKTVAIMADLQGPKLRTGLLKSGKPVELKRGHDITITTRKITGDDKCISTPYRRLPQSVNKNDIILMNDGLISLKVAKITETEIKCKILSGGILGEHKGINLPGASVKAPSLTAKDKKDLELCISEGVDFIALSFVRKASDIKKIKKIISAHKKDIPVIAKIEKPQAVENIDEILKISDGIMIARGDLGVEMNVEEVPVLQKLFIEKAAMRHRLVITATQMLESMIHSPSPTRAEASDISNAIMDGTDAIMLSAETASGNFPLESLKTMAIIAKKAESSPYIRSFHNQYDPESVNISLATASAACSAIHESKAKAIMVFTLSGATALLISKLGVNVPIIAATPEEKTLRRLCLYRGVIPIKTNFSGSDSKLMIEGEKAAIEKKLIKNGDTIIMLTGELSGRGPTSVMKILKVSV